MYLSGDYSEIQNNVSLSVDINERGQAIIEPENAVNRVSSTGVPGVTNEADLLRSLKNDFPMLDKKVVNNTLVYCGYLNKNITFHDVDSRSDYVRESANYRSFAVSALVTAIRAYLSISTAGVLSVLANYNSELNIFGYCERYYPIGWFDL